MNIFDRIKFRKEIQNSFKDKKDLHCTFSNAGRLLNLRLDKKRFCTIDLSKINLRDLEELMKSDFKSVTNMDVYVKAKLREIKIQSIT